MLTHPQDNCSPCKSCYGSVLKGIVKSPIIAGLCMGIPTYVILSGLGWMGIVFNMISVNSGAMSSYYAILGFTIGFWILELVSMYHMMPNVMAFCGFCHSAVGSWWFVNFIILLFTGWRYVAVNTMILALLGVLTPAIIWHMTGDIIRAYKNKMIAQIDELNSAPLASSAYVTADMEMGISRGKD